eukprot:s147_g10.t1
MAVTGSVLSGWRLLLLLLLLTAAAAAGGCCCCGWRLLLLHIAAAAAAEQLLLLLLLLEACCCCCWLLLLLLLLLLHIAAHCCCCCCCCCLCQKLFFPYALPLASAGVGGYTVTGMVATWQGSASRHEYIVRLYDIVAPVNMAKFDELYLVMEICDSDLKKLCRTDVSLTPLHINTLLYNLLVGMKYLHSAGIYHRDLKPANCLVNQDCSIKICDFGLSRAIGEAHAVEEPGEQVNTQKLKRFLTGHVVTRWYRAPELILLQENYTEAIDVWSIGCIYAELLGMLEGNKMEDRGPLFPGSSCFPLSPDHKHKTDYRYHTRGKHDQLNMIFNLLGTPTEADINLLEREDARRYIRCFAAREGDGIKSKFPQVEDDCVDILDKMLRFNPSQRISVAKALEHPLFEASIRDKSKEVTASEHVSLDFEKEPDLDEGLLRKYFCKESEVVGSRNYERLLGISDWISGTKVPPRSDGALRGLVAGSCYPLCVEEVGPP